MTTGTGKTVTRVDLCEAVYQKVGLSRTESSAFVELVLKEITDCLEKGETVKLSSFGTFAVRQKSQRMGRNPKTGTEVPIAPQKVVLTVDKHGNTSAASIPLALTVAVRDGRVKKGDLLLLEAMGGGFTWGSALVRW